MSRYDRQDTSGCTFFLGIILFGMTLVMIIGLLIGGMNSCSKAQKRREAYRIQQEREDPSSIRRYKVVNGHLRRDRAAEQAAQGEIRRQYENAQKKMVLKLKNTGTVLVIS